MTRKSKQQKDAAKCHPIGARVRLTKPSLMGWHGTATMIGGRWAVKDGWPGGEISGYFHEWQLLDDQTPNPAHAELVAEAEFARDRNKQMTMKVDAVRAQRKKNGEFENGNRYWTRERLAEVLLAQRNGATVAALASQHGAISKDRMGAVLQQARRKEARAAWQRRSPEERKAALDVVFGNEA